MASSVGKGALARVGEFYYPVRLLLRFPPPDKKGEAHWQVRWWRHCIFPSSTATPIADALVPESSIVDELWNNRQERRRIRVCSPLSVYCISFLTLRWTARVLDSCA